ncbi:signal peptidase I [Streptomyces sp. NPDC059578]|uniref:signal peptidase I n=1 Tax=Streptomyces sp. NPDC059578 TaxID=3346874 RepID=UPI003694F1C1
MEPAPAPADPDSGAPGPPGVPDGADSAEPSESGESPGSLEASEPSEARGGRSPLAEWLPGGRLTLAALALLVLLLLVTTFVLKPFAIPSSSMEPGLRAGDRVLVNKLAYRLGAEPQRGDVVVFDGTGYFGDAHYIKRIVGTGGDRVVCCDRRGRIEVNGRAVDEPYLGPGERPSQVPFDVVVPGASLFLLGDHRSASSDSRDHLGSPGGGMIPLDHVIGRAEWITWPFDRLTGVDRGGGFARVPDPPAVGGGHG